MASYIPINRIPLINICQEIQNARSRSANEEADIPIPPYLVDRRILRGIEYGNLGYISSYLQKCPRNILRYFYLESIASLSPTVRSVIVSSLFGYALLYRSIECMQRLLEQGSDPFQAIYFIEMITENDGDRKIVIYEAPCLILLAGCMQEAHRADAIEILQELRKNDVELHVPVAIRKQQIQTNQEPILSTQRFTDGWECLEKEIEKKGGENMAANKAMLREFKGVYRADKFERLNAT